MRRERADKLGAAFNGSTYHPKRDNRTFVPMSFRVTPQEKTAIKAYAGDKSVSRYLREVALKGQTSARPSSVSIKMDMAAQILAELGKSGVFQNLQKLSDAAECGALPLTDETLAEIEAACATIIALRADLMNALRVREKRS